jgi:hypothetical protein
MPTNCGGKGQPPCAPVPTLASGDFTLAEMQKAIEESYQKGRVDARVEMSHPTKDDL